MKKWTNQVWREPRLLLQVQTSVGLDGKKTVKNYPTGLKEDIDAAGLFPRTETYAARSLTRAQCSDVSSAALIQVFTTAKGHSYA